MQCYCNATYLIYQTYAEKNQLLILKKNKKKKTSFILVKQLLK